MRASSRSSERGRHVNHPDAIVPVVLLRSTCENVPSVWQPRPEAAWSTGLCPRLMLVSETELQLSAEKSGAAAVEFTHVGQSRWVTRPGAFPPTFNLLPCYISAGGTSHMLECSLAHHHCAQSIHEWAKQFLQRMKHALALLSEVNSAAPNPTKMNLPPSPPCSFQGHHSQGLLV